MPTLTESGAIGRSLGSAFLVGSLFSAAMPAGASMHPVVAAIVREERWRRDERTQDVFRAPTKPIRSRKWEFPMAPDTSVTKRVFRNIRPVFEPYFVYTPEITDVGYLSAPTLADIDADGDFDLFVGEVNGDIFFFENTGTPAERSFATASKNPFGLAPIGPYGQGAFVDMDDDGDLDALFGAPSDEDHTQASLFFFENTGTPFDPVFSSPVINPFGISGLGFQGNPSFADIDADGDFDLFAGQYSGDTRFFENTGSPTAASFASAQINPFGLSDVGFFSIPVFVDIDADGDLDVFYGEAYHYPYQFENTGTASEPNFVQTLQGPFGDPEYYSVTVPTFADIDADEDLDLYLGGYYGNTFLYENVGSPSHAEFILWIDPVIPPKNPFDLEGTGVHTSPALGDIDGDGDPDAFLGNNAGDITFSENTGTPSAAQFTGAVSNPYGLTPIGPFNTPALTDTDGDGDIDLWTGTETGDLYFFKNSGTAQEPAFLPPLKNPFGVTNDGTFSSPAFYDLDADGDQDLLVGHWPEQKAFYENKGTATVPLFSKQSAIAFSIPATVNPVFIDFDFDGRVDLLDRDGYVYMNNGSEAHPNFSRFPGINPYGLNLDDPQIHSTLADIDGDEDPDLFSGHSEGEVYFFENKTFVDRTPPECGQIVTETDPVTGKLMAVETTAVDMESGILGAFFSWIINMRGYLEGQGPLFRTGGHYFSPSKKSPIHLRGERIDLNKHGAIVVEVENFHGLTTRCDPLLETLEGEIPTEFALDQNYPNPFNPATTIRFQVAERTHVSLAIFDVLGREVVRLVDREMEPGSFEAAWDGLNMTGQPVAGGVYLYRMQTASKTITRTMTFIP